MSGNDVQAQANALLQAAQTAQMRYQLTGDEASGLEWVHHTMELGYLLYQQKDLSTAEKYYRRAYAIEAEMMERFSSLGVVKRVLDTCMALGHACLAQRRPGEAREFFQQGLVCYEQVVEGPIQMRDIRNYYSILSGLGQIFLDEGDYEQGAAYCERALRTCRDLAQEYHSIKDRVAAARFYRSMGDLNQQMKKPLKARLYYEQSAEEMERLLPEKWQKEAADLPMELGGVLEKLAMLYRQENDWNAAGDCYRRCVSLYGQRFSETHSESDATRYSTVLESFGLVLQLMGRPEESLGYLEQCLDLRSQLFELNRTEERYESLGFVYYNLAMGSTGAARMELARRAYTVWEELCKLHPDSNAYRGRLATVVRDLLT